MDSEHVVGGRYRLEDVLGNGGFSEVRRATDLVTGDTVAVKLSPLAMAADPATHELLLEADVVERLDHPNIVRVFDSGVEDDRAFMVMEYLDGPSLRAMVREEGPLEDEAVTQVGMRIADALQAAHDEGIVHNDIKPENIILVDGEPYLADFGVARNLALTLGTQEASKLAGTLAYIAPEVLQGGRPNAQSDIYSLGVTLYEALTGHLPLVGRTAEFGVGRASGGGSLEQVLERAIAPVSAARFKSAAEFHDALLSAAHFVPAPAPRAKRGLVALPFAGIPFSRLRPPATVQAMGAIVASLALVMLAAGAFSGGSEKEPPVAEQPTPAPTPAPAQVTEEASAVEEDDDDEKDDKDDKDDEKADEKKKDKEDRNRGQGRPWAMQSEDD